MDVIILSGGLGTRLKKAVSDRPKVMAPIKGRPFIEYTFEELKKFNIKNIILAVGYKSEYIENYFGNNYEGINIIYSKETNQLGTGGAIKQALQKTKEENVIVMNGDVYQKVDMCELMEKHINSGDVCTLTLKEMKNFDRFGNVKFDSKGVITSFEEKKFVGKGFINVGVYAMRKNIFIGLGLGEKFSIETDYFNKYVNKIAHNSYIYDGEFVDMGIVEDYQRLQDII